MNEEKSEKESKVKKKILKIVGTITVACVLVITAGCGIMGKGSRVWIEDKVANIEKVYPTENLEDLFEKFPNGFIIRQRRLFKEGDKSYSLELKMKGDKDTKKIEGRVRKIFLQSKPYKETVEKESKVEYIKGKNLVLEKPEFLEDLLPKNHFLFQKLRLNKTILKKLEFNKKDYTMENGGYGITYNINNSIIDTYLGVKSSNLTLRISGVESSNYNPYKHGIIISDRDKDIYYHELVSEHKEDLYSE